MSRLKLPYYTALFLSLLSIVVIILMGWVEQADRLLIRLSAKTSVFFFLLAFSASAMYKLWPSAFTRKLLKARRYLGLSFAVSHSFHLCFIFLLQFYFGAQNFEARGVFIVSGGGVAYAFLYLMAFTSTDAMQRKLGMKNWKRLHTLGSYYIFIVFCVSYLPRAFSQLSYLPFGILLLVALFLRLLAYVKK